MTEVRFKTLEVGDFFGGWGDLHSNYNYACWVIFMKENDSTACEINKNGSKSMSVAMCDEDEVFKYPDKESALLQIFEKNKNG